MTRASPHRVDYHSRLPVWSWLSPVLAWSVLLFFASSTWMAVGALIAAVLASVHHAEIVAHRVGEPFGTLVLALAVTAIELTLILSLMTDEVAGPSTLARDTVFAAVMIILNGMVGLCLLVGGQRHHEQHFRLDGASAALMTLAAITVLTLVLPNYTQTVSGPYYSRGQLMFIALVSLVLYLTFVFVQTVRHRHYFLPKGKEDDSVAAPSPSRRMALLSFILMVTCLGAVVLLAKHISPQVEMLLVQWGAPKAVVGILIAAIVLLPESMAAVMAARANRLQTSLNLALGSALASIGLTIPAVALLSLMLSTKIALGIDAKSSVLLILSLFISVLSLGTGRTTILQGVVHLVLFAAYLFMSVVP